MTETSMHRVEEIELLIALSSTCSFRAALRGWLGEETAPHSSTLAWRIPWMEEHGRLQSMGSLRVGHD